jgi:hypothetical protein
MGRPRNPSVFRKFQMSLGISYLPIVDNSAQALSRPIEKGSLIQRELNRETERSLCQSGNAEEKSQFEHGQASLSSQELLGETSVGRENGGDKS